MSSRYSYPVKFSGEELNKKEKKLFRITKKYFENETTLNINGYLDYLNNKGSVHKVPLIVKKEIFIMWLERRLESGNISKQIYLNLLKETREVNLLLHIFSVIT